MWLKYGNAMPLLCTWNERRSSEAQIFIWHFSNEGKKSLLNLNRKHIDIKIPHIYTTVFAILFCIESPGWIYSYANDLQVKKVHLKWYK